MSDRGGIRQFFVGMVSIGSIYVVIDGARAVIAVDAAEPIEGARQ
jgi:hypothetical protein